jgi:hypothetical protein
MIRLVIGSIVGGIAQWLVGFIFWGTPLGRIPFRSVSDDQNAALQAALAQYLTPSGTGTYLVPWPYTQQGTVLYGKGPVAMVHFNTGGFPVLDTSAIVGALILSIVTIFLLGLALWFIANRVTDFASRAKIVVLAAVATALYFTIGEPIYNPFLPKAYFVYLAIGNMLGLIAGGLVLVRWFLPRPGAGMGA